MSGNGIILAGTLGAAAAAGVASPLASVFNELGLVFAIMGMAGGMTFGIATRVPLREVFRGILLGGLMAFGFGSISPQIIERLFSVSFSADAGAVPVLAVGAFVIGYAQDLLVSWLSKSGGNHGE